MSIRRLSTTSVIVASILGGLAAAKTASAYPMSLFEFVIFSGGGASTSGGDETSIGGHTTVTGNIGSNQDLFMQGNPVLGYPAQLNGSAYARGNLQLGQDLTVGNVAGPLREVVSNGTADIGGGVNVYGNVYGNGVGLGQLTGIRKAAGVGGNVQYAGGGYTAPGNAVVEGAVSLGPAPNFGPITMPPATAFTAGGVNQTVPAGSGSFLTLAPGTYGALATSAQNQKVTLSSGNYYFDSITAQGNFTLEIDVSSGNPIGIYVVNNAGFAQGNTLKVKGAGTGGAFVSIDQASSMASLIYLETKARFTMSGASDASHNIWGGTVYASLLEGSSAEISIGQYTDWYGAAYALDSFDAADHGKWTYVPVPEPGGLSLLAICGLGFLISRSRSKPGRS